MGVTRLSIVKDIESKYKTDLRKRLFEFALSVFGVLKNIDQKKEFDVFKYQLSKSATSIGANYEEAQGAYSKKDFESKIGICLKESRETNYFLKLIKELEIAEADRVSALVRESEEISKILASILIKLRKK